MLGLNICTCMCVYSLIDTMELEGAVIGVFRRLEGWQIGLVSGLKLLISFINSAHLARG